MREINSLSQAYPGAQLARELAVISGYPDISDMMVPSPGFLRGPFEFQGSLPDNSIVAVDLTDGDQLIDSKYRFAFGSGVTDTTDKLKATLVVFGLELYLTPGAETPADIAALSRRLYVHHKPKGSGGVERVEHITRGTNAGGRTSTAVSTTATTTTMRAASADGIRRRCIFEAPFIVDMTVDTFEIAANLAVDMSAVVPFDGLLYGFAVGGNAGQQLSDWYGKNNPCFDKQIDPETYNKRLQAWQQLTAILAGF